MTSGILFDFKRFSLHDGPGIRTTVFLKGCPLHCAWCHNPESISPEVELHHWPERCIFCGECVEHCPENALSLSDHMLHKEIARCLRCGACATACPAEAWQQIGRVMTLPEVMAEIQKDLSFYDESGGGVTFSGGEPLLQPEFLAEALRACKAIGLHTAVDTTGYSAWKNLAQIRPNVDLFLYDLKLMDSARHRQFTGVPNETILANLRSLAAAGSKIIIRIPIIPGINDDPANLESTARFLQELNSIHQVDLLPYHHIAMSKYARMGVSYTLPDTAPPSAEHIQNIQTQMETYGFKVTSGG